MQFPAFPAFPLTALALVAAASPARAQDESLFEALERALSEAQQAGMLERALGERYFHEVTPRRETVVVYSGRRAGAGLVLSARFLTLSGVDRGHEVLVEEEWGLDGRVHALSLSLRSPSSEIRAEGSVERTDQGEVLRVTKYTTESGSLPDAVGPWSSQTLPLVLRTFVLPTLWSLLPERLEFEDFDPVNGELTPCSWLRVTNEQRALITLTCEGRPFTEVLLERTGRPLRVAFSPGLTLDTVSAADGRALVERFERARPTPAQVREEALVWTLLLIANSQDLFRRDQGRWAASFQELADAGLLDLDLDVWQFEERWEITLRRSVEPKRGWVVVANPREATSADGLSDHLDPDLDSAAGARTYAVDARGLVYVGQGQLEAPDDGRVPAETARLDFLAAPDPAPHAPYLNEAAVLYDLYVMHVAQQRIRRDTGSYAATLRSLAEQGLIDRQLAGGRKHGYRFALLRSPDAPADAWMLVANPIQPGQTGNRAFVINHQGRTHYREDGLAFGLNPACRLPSGAVRVGE
jgi:hypothetical protein